MTLKFKPHTVSIAFISLVVFTLLLINPGCKKHDIKWDLERINPIDSTNSTINPQGSPTVNTISISNITQNSAIVSGELTDQGNSTITQHGHCWATTSNPTTSNSNTTLGATSNTGNFSSNLSGLISNTSYYVRAYATNSSGTAYGNQINFTAGQNTYAPIVTTGSVNNITAISASVPGTITDLGGSTITQHGHCWSSSSNPTISNSKTTLGFTSTIGSFNSNISNLNPITTYYIRTYATNNTGTAYGNQVSCTTDFQNVTCNITSSTNNVNGWYFMLNPSVSLYHLGNTYTIEMSSPQNYYFSPQNVCYLYLNEQNITSFGGNFSSYTNGNGLLIYYYDYTIPAGLTASNCYTIRVLKAQDTWISDPFTIY